MEAVKSGLGLTSKNSQEGTEPLSGEMGKGTGTEPYDQGNASGERISRHFFPYRWGMENKEART